MVNGRNFKVRRFKKHSKCERKWTKADTKISMIDYATCSEIHHENIIKLLVDVHEGYQIKNKNKSDHNTI